MATSSGSALDFKMPIAVGEVDWKTEETEPGVAAKTLVDHRFAVMQSMIDDATEDFNSSLEVMRATLTPIVVAAIPTSGISVDGISGDIPDFTKSFDAVFSATLDDFTVEYTEPAGKPDAADSTWEDMPIYLQDELVNKLAVWLLSGESAIPDALFSQIYNAAVTEYQDDIYARRSAILSEAAARGWDCPSDVEAARLIQLEREYSKGASDVAAKIAEKNMELVQANFHKAAEVAASYIQVQLDYVIRKNIAKIEWYSKAVDAWVKQVEANISVMEANITAFNGKVEAFKAKGAAYATEAAVFDSLVRAYTSQVEAIKTKISAQIESIKAEVMVYQADSTTAIENEKLRVQAQVSNNELAERLAEAESNFHVNLIASGIGALHVQAGVSASHNTGEQVGFSYSYGQQYGESQSRSEQKIISDTVD